MSLLVAEAKLWLQLSPAYLGDVDLGIREQLNASLLQHVSALHGAVLAYDSLKLLDGLGCIRNDLPHMHLPVSLRILVFAPRIGDVLHGVVRRQGTDHTALLVHGAEWGPNSSAVALAGVSCGGGIAALAAAHDRRVSCVISLSGWAASLLRFKAGRRRR